MRFVLRFQLALTLLASVALQSFGAPRTFAQYIYLDTNGDGVSTASDTINPTGTTDLDVWIVTDAMRDGTPATCSSQDGDLTISAYEVILHASNGTLQWSGFVNRRPEFGASLGEASNGTDYRNGQTAGGSLPPGRYRLATVTVAVASGTPSVGFAASTTLGGSFTTSFASQCSGNDFDNTLKYGSDWFDADGAAYGGEANRPPTLGPVADMTVAEVTIATQDIVADDADGDPLQFQMAAGFSFTSVATLDPGAGHATGRITLAPAYDDAGAYSARVEVTDGFSYAGATFAITVTPTDRAPFMAQPPDLSTTEGTPASVPLVADDGDQDLLTFSLASGPAFVTVTTLQRTPRGIGRLDAAPGLADAGDYTASISVTDGILSDTKSISIHVAEGFDFRDPVLLSPIDMVVTAGEAAEQTLHGRAPDGSDVVFSKARGPAFMDVSTVGPGTDGTLGTLRLAPGPGDVGAFEAAVLATGAGDATEASFRITVIAPGDPPPVGPFDFVTPNTSVNVGVFPQDLAIGDLDGDGVADLVSVDHFGGTLTLAFGRGDGAFPRRQTYDVGALVISVAIADFDRDGRNDIVFASLDSDIISVLHGVGASLFGHRKDYATGREPAYVSVADLNDDAIPDLVVANEVDNTVSVLLGLAAGGFAPRVDYPVGEAPCQLSVGDVNHDARLDVVVVNEDGNTLSVLLNMGLGALGPQAVYGTGVQPRTVDIADLNLDGNPDLVVPNFSGDTFSVLLGNGDGSFASRSDVATGRLPWGLALGDFNRDGYPDVTVAETGDRDVSVFLGDGTGRYSTRTSFAVGAVPRTVRLGDLNHDGLIDQVTCNEASDDLTILLGNGDGTFGVTAPIATPRFLWQPQAGRIDEDDIDDLVLNDYAGGLRVLYGDGRGGSVASAPLAEGIRVSNVAMGDWNGDGRTDLAFTGFDAQAIVVLLNAGGRVFGPPTSFDVGAKIFDIASADWNADGHADLAVDDPIGRRFFVYRGLGDGAFALAETKTIDGMGRALTASDWNSDGIADLAVGMSTPNGVAIFFGAANAPLVSGPAFPTRLAASGIAFDDLERDGSPEMLVTGARELTFSDLGTLTVYRRGADAVPEPAYERRTGKSTRGVLTADLNGDGFPDAVVGEPGSNVLYVFPGSRNGVLGSRVDMGPVVYGMPAVIDWDGDGAPDLITNDQDRLLFYRNRIPHAPALLAARAFTTAENRVTRLPAGKPTTCVQVEPVAQAFAIQEVDPASITMRSTETGDVGEISADLGKEIAVGDRDRNGVPELAACFSQSSLAGLFSRLTGSSTVPVTIRGALVSGERFEASLELTVVAGGGPPKVTVAPNPMNPTATMTVVTDAAGPLRVRLYDASGRLVRTVVDARRAPAGAHALPIEAAPRGGRRLASGIYYFRVEAAGGTETGRIAIVK